ncbi:MAG: zinc ABC transporter substrate-binding protein [Candidatus Aminicenantes bacterium]|nr:zinc ABC transporter substrate-binding protein [Candidatus Aminicenantes bacterium]
MKSLRCLLLASTLVLAAAGYAPLAAKVRIMATVFPLREFAAAVAGDRGETELLLPPGAGVHTWQPRPGDIGRLAACDLLVYIGANLEPWLPGLLKALPGGKVRALEATSGLSLLEAAADDEPGHGEGAHGQLDPHVWLDFELDAAIVRKIADELSRIDPAGRSEFTANADRLTARLRGLDTEFRDGLAACRGRDIVLAGHGAFGYLARRYGLVQIALYGLSPDAQPRPIDLMKAVEFCRQKGVRTIFFENSVPPGLSRTLAREIGGRVLVLHAGHNLTREEQARGVGFFALMEDNLNSLRDGLGCR